MSILFISKTWRLINLKYYATFNFWKTQNLFESYKTTSNCLLTQYYQQKNEDFAMEWCFFIWLHPSFYNVISLNLTPLKVGLCNEIFLSRPWNFYFKSKRSIFQEAKCVSWNIIQFVHTIKFYSYDHDSVSFIDRINSFHFSCHRYYSFKCLEILKNRSQLCSDWGKSLN